MSGIYIYIYVRERERITLAEDSFSIVEGTLSMHLPFGTASMKGFGFEPWMRARRREKDALSGEGGLVLSHSSLVW